MSAYRLIDLLTYRLIDLLTQKRRYDRNYYLRHKREKNSFYNQNSQLFVIFEGDIN